MEQLQSPGQMSPGFHLSASTFSQPGFLCCLTLGEDCLHKDPHGASGGVNTTNNTEAEAFLDTGTFLKLNIVDGDSGELVATRYFTVLDGDWLLYGTLVVPCLPGVLGQAVHTGALLCLLKVVHTLRPVQDSVHGLRHPAVLVGLAGSPLY